MRAVRRLLSSLLVLGALASPAWALTSAQIPSPRPEGWVTDLTGTLPLHTVAELNRLGDQLESETGAGMAVVVVGSTDGAPVRDLAARLFAAWGIGWNGKGLLLFVSVTEGTAEIVLGDSLRDPVRLRESAAVVQGEMAPRFRSGDAAGAILQGAAACARRLLGADGATASVADLQVSAARPTSPPAPPAPASGTGLLTGILFAASAIVLPLMQEIRHRLLVRQSIRTLEPARFEEATGSR
ncbi:MAG: uncharacterized protein QOF89_5919 [Acidobacteriota bacterium]|nr:uncharacterized protein [Acidobacteriota bacterium]